MTSDTARQQRAAAAFALAFASATITALAGVLALDLPSLRLLPTFGLEMLPDSTWPAAWLPGAVSAAQQQQAGAEQWLHVILIFGSLTVAIACINALIGLLSHANDRRYETAVRGVVGASPRQLRRAIRRNALVNATVGVVTGVPAGVLAAVLIRSSWQSRGADATTQTWAFLALCITLLVVLLAARLSSRRLARPGWLGDALAPEARSAPGWGAEDLRALLTVAQLACGVALTTVSLLAWSAGPFVAQNPESFTGNSQSGAVKVARVSLSENMTSQQRREAYTAILTRLVDANGITAESIASPGVLLGMGKMDKVISDCGRCYRSLMFMPLLVVETQHHVVGSNFFATAGITLKQGREFAGGDDDARAVIVNDTFARLAFQGQDPIGKRIKTGGFRGEWHRVIGVVPDVHAVGLRYFEGDPLVAGSAETGTAPAVYFAANEYTPATFDVVVRTNSSDVTLAGLAFEPVAQLLAKAAAPQQAFARVVTLLGLLLCGAAGIGTFITTLLNVKSRRTEIAVRRALGARRRDIWLLVYGSVANVVARGVFAGLIISAALSRAIEVFVPRMPVFDVRAAALVSAAFAFVAFVSALPPTRSALRISPARGSQD